MIRQPPSPPHPQPPLPKGRGGFPPNKALRQKIMQSPSAMLLPSPFGERGRG